MCGGGAVVPCWGKGVCTPKWTQMTRTRGEVKNGQPQGAWQELCLGGGGGSAPKDEGPDRQGMIGRNDIAEKSGVGRGRD